MGGYPRGAAVRVFYDPKDPSRCVLKPGVISCSTFTIALGCGFIFLGGFLPLWVCRQRYFAFGWLGLVFTAYFLIASHDQAESHDELAAKEKEQVREVTSQLHQRYLEEIKQQRTGLKGWACEHRIGLDFVTRFNFNSDGTGECIHRSSLFERQCSMRYTQDDEWLIISFSDESSLRARVDLLAGRLHFVELTVEGSANSSFSQWLANEMRKFRFDRVELSSPIIVTEQLERD